MKYGMLIRYPHAYKGDSFLQFETLEEAKTYMDKYTAVEEGEYKTEITLWEKVTE